MKSISSSILILFSILFLSHQGFAEIPSGISCKELFAFYKGKESRLTSLKKLEKKNIMFKHKYRKSFSKTLKINSNLIILTAKIQTIEQVLGLRGNEFRKRKCFQGDYYE